MAETTNIGWCDGTLNFWIGCTKVSVGEQCDSTGVPFYFKQWSALRPKGRGCEMDGREWKERPKVAPIPSVPQAPPSPQPVSGEMFW